MTNIIEAYREYARKHDLERYEVPGGFGIRFSDGFDVFWVLPEEKWHFLNNTVAPLNLNYFHELNERRERVVEAIRRYLAKQRVAIDRSTNGDWSCMRDEISSNLTVGANLTRTLTSESNLVAAVRGVFEGSFVRGPSERRAERHLSEFSQALEEIPWPEEDETLLSMPETPLVALGWMGLCKAMKHESSFESPEAFAAAAEPKGRIGRALLQVAQRLPETKAAVELCDGSMCIDFSDEYDSFSIAPKSQKLRDLLHAMEPEHAGDNLADEYERLNSARRRVLNAVFETLNRHDYLMDSSENEHVGRNAREFLLDLGESLTNAIQQSGEEFAVRQVLNQKDEFTDEAVSLLSESVSDVRLVERSLPPSVPASLMLSDITEEQLAVIDERSNQLLRKFIESETALSSYRDPLMWDSKADTWASPDDWLKLAREHIDGKYPRMDAELILFDLGDESDKPRIIERMEAAEPHYECMDEEIEMMWRLRKEMPNEAEKWFAPQQSDDVPFAEVRARLHDPIAICHVLGGITDDEEDEVVPHLLAIIPTQYLRCFVSKSRIVKWRAATEEWAKQNWQWNWGGEAEVLAVAGNQRWLDAFVAIEHNPFLLTGLFDDVEDEPSILYASNLLLAWSRYAPSAYLMKLVGVALRTDMNKVEDRLVLHKLGKQGDSLATCPGVMTQLTDAWSGCLGVSLAISWQRCRKHVALGTR